jgi:murein L,D-transpeptidase YcbB/YkuD
MIENILATRKETEVPLDNPIPVHLMYLTAWVDQFDHLHFRDDIYGRDEALAQAMHDTAEAPQQTSEL